MSPSLARALTLLHAPAWRARYGDEFEALLIELPASPGIIADVMANVLRSRRRPIVAAILAGASILGLVTSQSWRPSNDLSRTRAVNAPAKAACTSYSSVPQGKAPTCALG